MKVIITLLFLLLAYTGVNAETPGADTIDSDITGMWQDTYINSSAPTTYYGTSELIRMAISVSTVPVTTQLQKGLWQHDYTLAASKRLDSAKVLYYLTYASPHASGNSLLSVRQYRVMKGPWYADDPTWNYAIYGNNWATAGAGSSSGSCTENAGSGSAPDVVSNLAPSSCGAQLSSTAESWTSGTWYSFRCDSMVNRWAKGVSSNYGALMQLVSSEEPISTRYDTLIFASSDNGVASHRPKLIVWWTDTTAVQSIPKYRQGPLGAEDRQGPKGPGRRQGP